MQFKAVFFDLDGTLADSLVDLAVSTNYVLQKHGFPAQPVSAYQYFAGDGIAKMIERAMPAEAVCEETLCQLKADWLEYYGQHYADRTTAYEGLTALVCELKEKGVRLAVVTNKAQEMAEFVVHKLFGDDFDIVLGLREGLPAKPDPTGIFMTMEELGVSAEDCAFVGDTGMDVSAGVNAGVYPIGVLWGFRKKEELVRFGAKAFANNAAELREILLGGC